MLLKKKTIWGGFSIQSNPISLSIWFATGGYLHFSFVRIKNRRYGRRALSKPYATDYEVQLLTMLLDRQQCPMQELADVSGLPPTHTRQAWWNTLILPKHGGGICLVVFPMIQYISTSWYECSNWLSTTAFHHKGHINENWWWQRQCPVTIIRFQPKSFVSHFVSNWFSSTSMENRYSSVKRPLPVAKLTFPASEKKGVVIWLDPIPHFWLLVFANGCFCDAENLLWLVVWHHINEKHSSLLARTMKLFFETQKWRGFWVLYQRYF